MPIGRGVLWRRLDCLFFPMLAPLSASELALATATPSLPLSSSVLELASVSGFASASARYRLNRDFAAGAGIHIGAAAGALDADVVFDAKLAVGVCVNLGGGTGGRTRQV